ncbi:F-box protein At1g49990-like [Amaranthus tricolor]|uniref:F-box protein At1g49990-like n=1 Tax=Amaranthus tricolor TaxID=29722 RepID=UPI00258BAAB5|nr:F-box protein At1g49990-like [Amaranthus tricolor]
MKISQESEMADDNTVQNSCGNLDSTISDVLLREIINYLHPKSVIRFKSVSRNWNSIISEPNFIPSYISRNSIPSWFIFERTLNTSSNARFPIELVFQKPLNLSTLTIDFHKLAPYPLLDNPTLIDSSDGLLLVGSEISSMSQWRRASEYHFFVINAVNNEWVALPKPPVLILNHFCLGLITQIDRNNRVFKKFMVVDYLLLTIADRFITLICFSSETAQWEYRLTNYRLGNHIWGLSGGGKFEFDGKLIWFDLSVGLMIWDDPFSTEYVIKSRLIRLPLEHVRFNEQTRLDDERRIDNGGGHIQYLHVNKLSIVSLWRLDNLEQENWNCLYTWDLRQLYPHFGKVRPVLIHPFEDLVAIFRMEDTMFSLDLKTAKLKNSSPILSHINMLFVSVLLPSWPTFFTPNIHARFLEEHGNQYFSERKYEEAIDFYTQSIEYTENMQVYMLRGKTYNKLHKSHEANKDFLKVLEIDSYFYKEYRKQEVINNDILSYKSSRLNNQHLSSSC